VELLRQQLPALDTGLFSLTQRLGVLIARYLGDDSETAIRQLRLVWHLLRPLLWQRPACVPRIWAT
jgi:urease accessory protein